MTPDVINGIFEIIAGILLFRNVQVLHRDKAVRGVSVLPTSFFMAWGYWNLYFYPSLNCDWSFIGGILVVIANTIWVGQMVYYNRENAQ